MQLFPARTPLHVPSDIRQCCLPPQWPPTFLLCRKHMLLQPKLYLNRTFGCGPLGGWAMSCLQNSVGTGVLSYTTVFKDIIVENIIYTLHTKGQNLRVLFKRFDKNSYGYITATQVCLAQQCITEPTPSCSLLPSLLSPRDYFRLMLPVIATV